MTTAAPLIFGKYEIQHRLAIGGMGEVFYAVQKGVPGFERPVILKSLLPDLAQQPGFIDQFLDEARVAATLNHPNVVSIFEVGLWNGTYFIAMEYIRGRNLAQLLHRCVEAQVMMPGAIAARIIADAALGLDHAHQARSSNGEPLNVIHRDISPQNIMLRDDGVTKVVDFGIARAANRATRTATGTLKGKMAYMAPEQIRDEHVSGAVDQYALGVCLWEMLTRRRLFKAPSDLEVLKLVLQHEIPAPSTLAEGIDPVLDAITMRMLQIAPADRFATCGEVAAALADHLATQSPSRVLQPGPFMRSLGTEDLVIKRPGGDAAPNFVISLEGLPSARPSAPGAATAELAIRPLAVGAPPPPPQSATGVIQIDDMGLAPTPSTGRRAMIGVVGAVVVAGVAAAWALSPRPGDAPLSALDAGVTVAALVPPPATPSPDVAAVEPKVVERSVLVISSVPPGASMRVDGRPEGVTPRELSVSAGTAHFVSIERDGYQRQEVEVPALGSAERREVVVKLVKTARVQPVVAPVQPVATDAAPGFLTLNTTPWSKVSIDGEPVGSTPIFKKKLSAGAHTLVLVNEGASIQKSQTVTIKPGETNKLSLTLAP